MSSTSSSLSRIEVLNHLDNTYRSEMAGDILQGLTATQKKIPSKYFYDARGSELFDEICALPEYYPTRTEMSILEDCAPDVMSSFQGGDLVELGSGANYKIRMLLDVAAEESKLQNLRYVPVDVSETALISASEELLRIYPEIRVLGVVADFTRHTDLIPKDRPKLTAFFGGTLGNFDEKEGVDFLQHISGVMKRGDRLLIGFDMLKTKKTLEAAYNDSQGITSEFNKNVLRVLNRELDADFDPSCFDHKAFFNEEKEQVEMHLQANRRVLAKISDLGLKVELEEGETIHTEISRKFSRESAEDMAFRAGFIITQWFSDPKEWFSLAELRLRD